MLYVLVLAVCNKSLPVVYDVVDVKDPLEDLGKIAKTLNNDKTPVLNDDGYDFIMDDLSTELKAKFWACSCQSPILYCRKKGDSTVTTVVDEIAEILG